jgi:hypothetical protein
MHTITNDPGQGLVTTTFAGDVSVEERCCSLEEILALARSTGASRMLVDFSAARFRIEDLATVRHLANRIAAHEEQLRKLQIAYVMPANKLDPAVEILARGRGLFAERFSSAQAALDWLSEGSKPDKKDAPSAGPRPDGSNDLRRE